MSVEPLPASSPEPLQPWRRPLGLAESLFWQLDRIMCGNFVAQVELSGAVPEERVALGLAALVEAHPLLRSRIVEDAALGRPCFEEVAPASPELTRLPPEPEALLLHGLRELDRSFDDSRAPLFRAYWAGDGTRTWLGLSFHHALGDGRSGTRLLAEWIRFLAEGVAPRPTPPPPAQESFYRPEDFGAPDKAHHLATVVADIRARAQTLAPGNIVPGLCERLSLTREPGHHAFELSPEQTDLLLRACRRHGMTVHGALGAAYLGALHEEFLPPGKSVVMSLASPVDLRGAHRGPVPADDVAVRLSGVVSRIRMSNQEDFWALADTVTRDVRTQVELGNAHLLHDIVHAQTPSGLTKENGVAMLEGMKRFPWTSVLTNVGRVPAVTSGGTLEARRWVFLGAPLPTQALVMSVNTCHGLRVDTVYDRQNLVPERAESLLRRFEARLLGALGAEDVRKT